MLFGKKNKETLKVLGMSCRHCEQTVEKGVTAIAGVDRVKAHADTNTVEIFYKGEALSLDAVKNKIVELGYEVV